MAWLHKHFELVGIAVLALLAVVWLALTLSLTMAGVTAGSIALRIVMAILTAGILSMLFAAWRYFSRLFIKVEAQGGYIVFHRRRKQILIKKTDCRIVEELPHMCLFHLINGKVLKCPTRYILTGEPILEVGVINKVNFPNAKLK